MSLTTVTVTGKWRLPDGTIPAGTVSFTPDPPFANLGDDIIVGRTVTAELDDDGAISVELYATDDADTSPDQAQYRVAEQIGGHGRTYNVEMPNTGPQDLADLVPTTAPATVAFAPLAHTHDSGTLDSVDGGTP